MHDPRPSILSIPAFLTLAAVLPGLGGCVSRTESFAGHDRAAVWTAMVKAAEEPQPKDWKTVDNDVWSDAESRRIEIHRLNRRYLQRNDGFSRMESREWDFAVSLGEPEGDGTPPEVTFAIRGAVIPAWGWAEADSYFARVWELLGGRETELSAARRKYLEAIEAERAGEPRPQSDPDGDDLMHPKPMVVPTEEPVGDPASPETPPPIDIPGR